MSRMSPLNSPLLLGFDEFERTLERIEQALGYLDAMASSRPADFDTGEAR